MELIDKDWKLFSEVLVLWLEGQLPPEIAQQEAEAIRRLHTPQGLSAALRAAESIDVTELLPRIQAPTPVLHRRDGRPPLDEAMAALHQEFLTPDLRSSKAARVAGRFNTRRPCCCGNR